MQPWIDGVLRLVAQLSVPAIAVTLILAALGAHRRRQHDASQRRRAVVIRVLDTLEATVRRHASLRGWFLPAAEIDWALIYPRLFLELDTRDQAIAGWMWRQVQLMLLEPDGQKQITIASRIGGQVLAWQQNTITAEWFEHELAADPIQQPFIVPKRVQLRRTLRQFRVGLIAGGLLLAGRRVWSSTG
jgi:hypothetical protein